MRKCHEEREFVTIRERVRGDPAARSATLARFRRSRPRSPESMWQGNGSILVIDDEPGVRRVARRILEKCGLTVLLAESGRAGVGILDSGQRVDSVLLDLTMPEMDGAQTFHELRERRPELPIVLCSGYSRAEVRRHFEGEKSPRLVEKPFSPKALVEAIRSTLEDSTG